MSPCSDRHPTDLYSPLLSRRASPYLGLAVVALTAAGLFGLLIATAFGV